MTLTLNDRVRHAERGNILAQLGAKALALAAGLRRRRNLKGELARLSPRDLCDIGLTANYVNRACSRPLAQDVATELYCAARLRCENW
jgi:uncharacterized protein YjiS (DUF1127 family)